jgi:FkbM family methyltransferase
MSCIFTNDNNTTISLIEHPFSQTFASRNEHEVLFRKIHTYLICGGIIKNNIIDLGAWIGDNSIPWSKMLRSIESKMLRCVEPNIIGCNERKVYSIDPSIENCAFIQKMCEHNEITNIKIFQTAVSNKSETLSTNDDMYHCTFVEGIEGRNKVCAVSLDTLFSKGEIENIGYIHLDVEGMEYKVILGSENIINACRPIITFEQHLEIDNYMLILEHLENRNYCVFLIDEVLPGCRPDCRNSIAFPKESFDPNILNEIHRYIGREILMPL